MYIRYNLLGLGLCLEPHIPENIVDEMNKVLVQQWNLLDNSSLCRVSERNRAGSQRNRAGSTLAEVGGAGGGAEEGGGEME